MAGLDSWGTTPHWSAMEETPFVLVTTNAGLSRIESALLALDGIRKNPQEFEPFLFNPETMLAIATNIELVETKLRPYRRAIKALGTTHKMTPGTQITDANAAAYAAFMDAMDLLDQTEVKVEDLQKINRAKLNIGHDKKKEQNNIPASVLAKLAPLLED